MTSDTIYELKNEILDLVDIIAEAVVKKLRPAADEITPAASTNGAAGYAVINGIC